VYNNTRFISAKFLQQIKDGNPPVPVEMLIQAKAKEPPTDALPKFIEAYSSHKRVATLVKESYGGKLMSEWNQGIDKLANKPEQVDMAPALSVLMAVKDEEELVRRSLTKLFRPRSDIDLAENHSHGGKPHVGTPCSPYRSQTGDDTGQRSQDLA
jgi:hypothetical protein